MRATPGVQSAGLTQSPPLGLDGFDRLAFVPEGVQLPRDRENFTATMDTVDEGFFPTMGIAILHGRGVLTSDAADAPRVAVVNEQFAAHYWPNADAVGQHIRFDSRAGTSVEVVGVAQTVTYRQTFERPTDFVYLPLAQHPAPRMFLLLRSNGDPRQLIAPLKDVVRALNAHLPISETRTYEDVIQKVMEDANLKLASVATDASTSSSGRPPTSISVRTISIAATLTPSADHW